MSHGQTADGGASIVVAWVVRIDGLLTISSPGNRRLRSARVEPQVRPSHCRLRYDMTPAAIRIFFVRFISFLSRPSGLSIVDPA
jgi:hypothetical protein